MSRVTTIKSELNDRADPERAANLQRFFQTDPGGYGEGTGFSASGSPRYERSLESIVTLLWAIVNTC